MNRSTTLNASKVKIEPFYKKVFEQDLECNDILEDLEQKND